MKEIPDYQTLMLPVLKSVADGKEHKIKEITESLSKEFSLTEEELKNGNPCDMRTCHLYITKWLNSEAE